MPNTTSASPSPSAERASAGSSSARDSQAQATVATRALPSRRHSAPVSVIVAMAPADAPSSAMPSIPGEAPTAAFTAGMRTAQLAKMKPSTAKKTVMAARTGVVPLRAARGSGSLYSSCTKQG